MKNPQQTAFGQYGSKLAENGGSATPDLDDGLVFVAITALTDATIEGDTNETTAETGFTCPISMPLPTGVTVYGRWTKVTVGNSQKVICYQGK